MECVMLNLLEPKTGQSVKGSWKRQEIIVETIGEFKRKVCFVNWNDKVDISTIKPGDKIKIAFDAESREYNNRWYTDLKIWRIDVISSSPLPDQKTSETQPEDNTYMPPDDDDLPF